jgi:putative CocE/NonD family hydrolase
MSRTLVRSALSILAVLAAAPVALAQAPAAPPATDYRTLYTKREVMIPMRDGVRLFTAIYIPKDTTRLHPIMMTRTPYSVAPYGADQFPGVFRGLGGGQLLAYVRAGYIGVFQDVRGRWMSEGTFMDVRPYIEHKTSNRDVDESSDTYDTAEWLIHNVAGNNGRIGVRGTSYPGFYASMAAIDAHPAIKAVSPQAPVTEWMGGDDFMHNGALLLPHAFDFYWGFGWPRPQPNTHDFHPVNFGTPDGYQFFLKLGPISNANTRIFHDSVAFWDSIAAHPTWDAFWAARSVRPHLRNLHPAMLWVGGWFDTENLWGALHAYAAAEAQSPGAVNRLVMGPWSHGQWNGGTADSLGAVGWGFLTAQVFTDSIEVPFFNYYLLGDSAAPAPRAFEAAVFNTGANVWRYLDAWPPRNTAARNLYLQADGGLAFAAPRAHGRLFDEYVSDPAKPVPYTAAITHWYQNGFMVEDQRFAGRRPDVLVYEMDVLDSAVTVAGPVDVAFSVSTSGTDCDWIVKVIDVFPDTGAGRNPRAPNTMAGYEMLVRGDVLRGKFRNSMSRPEPFVPNAVTPIHYRMNDIFHTFRPGHRIMVQVQSTWFPMIDRNPGRFMDIWHATDADFHKTTQRVFRSAEYPSHVVLPVLTGAP